MAIMNRRDFVRSGALAAGVAASPASSKAKSRQALLRGREVYPLMTGWKYSATQQPAARQMDFDDSSLKSVALPHTNVQLPWHGFDDKLFQFVSTYRRTIKTPSSAKGKRTFVDFAGAMIASSVWLNGTHLGEYRGGYTPFSFELTDHLSGDGHDVLVVDLDSTERKDIPPFGHEVDYLTFGGIYREVSLRVVPQIFIENICATPHDALTADPKLKVAVYLDRPAKLSHGDLSVRVMLRDGDTLLAEASGKVAPPPATSHHWEDSDQAKGARAFSAADDTPAISVTLSGFKQAIKLWTLKQPKLYDVTVQLLEDGAVIDEDRRRTGFREAVFTDHGFSLNGEIVKLHGLDRHQTFPWVGQAMAARGQRQDAHFLRHDLNCNIVRTSHYPQSTHFLDACDEMGLLVLEEIPGWQHIGDLAWQDVSVDNVRRMVRRDWNHPSVVLWGVRINESHDSHEFYTRTNALARALDPSRQTCGIRTTDNASSDFLEDVFTYNDFGWPIHKPNHGRFLNTEFVGHTFPTKTTDAYERQREHLHRHARMHDALASDPQYAGGLGWCAFDYATHANFGSGDHICYHGVMDIFRTPKPAALFYKSMVEPEDEIVLEPAFYWARNDESSEISKAVICSNVEHIKMFTVGTNGDVLAGEGGPDRETYQHLKHPPFALAFNRKALQFPQWGDLRIEGYIGGKLVATRILSGDGVDAKFVAVADETKLRADGGDAVRVVLRSEDKYGNLRHYAADAITLTIEGEADLIGDNPFGLIGGTGAVWVRARTTPGEVVLKARHPFLGEARVALTLSPVEAETV